MAMMQDRLDAAAPFLQRNGALFASIDHVERNGLTEALACEFRSHSATDSMSIRPAVPRASGH
jgi:hypothetical protein